MVTTSCIYITEKGGMVQFLAPFVLGRAISYSSEFKSLSTDAKDIVLNKLINETQCLCEYKRLISAT